MVNMKILDLPLKAKWYEMIESGNKKEEYREIKKYWIGRLAKCGYVFFSTLIVREVAAFGYNIAVII